jgi:hypothetical protein
VEKQLPLEAAEDSGVDTHSAGDRATLLLGFDTMNISRYVQMFRVLLSVLLITVKKTHRNLSIQA